MNKTREILLIAALCLFIIGCKSSNVAGETKTIPVAPSQPPQQTNVQQTYPKDALHKAAYQGNVEEVKAILKTKPDPDARESFGGTALHAAMFQKNIQIQKLRLL